VVQRLEVSRIPAAHAERRRVRRVGEQVQNGGCVPAFATVISSSPGSECCVEGPGGAAIATAHSNDNAANAALPVRRFGAGNRRRRRSGFSSAVPCPPMGPLLSPPGKSTRHFASLTRISSTVNVATASTDVSRRRPQ
jgi:hypothetical protein